MADDFFTKPESPPEAPDQAPVINDDTVVTSADIIPPAPPAQPAVEHHETPALPMLEGATTASDIARNAHRRTRRILLGISFLVIIIIGLLAWFVWRLVKPAVAPKTSNQATTANASVNTPTTNKPEPTLNAPLTGSNSSSSGTAGWPAMTPDFVKNLTFASPQIWSTVNGWKDVPERFTLQKGVARFDAGWNQNGQERVTIHMTTFVKDEAIGTGDIDGDGLADAVAILKWTDGGTGAFPLLYTIMGNQPYDPLLSNDIIASVIGGSYSATKVNVSRNLVNLELTFPKANDQNCCWTGQANITLKWVDGLWQQ